MSEHEEQLPSAPIQSFNPKEEDGLDFEKLNEYNRKHPPQHPAWNKQSPDEERPVDWRIQAQQRRPPSPFENVDCAITSRAPSGRTGSLIYWGELVQVTTDAKQKHEQVGTELEQYRHAEKSPELRALGYILPSKDWKGDVDDLTDQQELPQRGGMKLDQLFKGNELVMSRHDRQAVDAAAKAGKSGHGTIDAKMLDVVRADGVVDGAVQKLKGVLEGSEGTLKLQNAALRDIAAFNATQEAGAARKEIEDVQGRAQTFKNGIGAVTSLISATMFFKGIGGDPSMGDGVGQTGSLAGMLVDYLAEDRLQAARARLDVAEETYASESAKSLQAKLSAARHAFLASLDAIAGARQDVNAALTDRRKAYNALGASAARHAPCPEQSRRRMGAILSAIPLVEYVVGRARSLTAIAAASRPVYTVDAGKGYAMAVRTGEPKVSAFLRVVGEIEHTRFWYASVTARWEHRLQQLVAVKDQIGGHRPG